MRRPRPSSPSPSPARPTGFTLLELLVTMTILVVVAALASRILGGAADAWVRLRGNAAAFEGANAAFDTMTRHFAQAALNTYWDYDPPSAPTRFRRASDLHFLMGPGATILSPNGSDLVTSAAFFQAPLGQDGSVRRLPELLNGVGYFIRFDNTQETPGFLAARVSPRWRYRLYEWIEPSSTLAVYETGPLYDSRTWITNRLFASGGSGQLNHSAVIAENVIGLIMMAEYPDGAGGFNKSYLYDSRNTAAALTEHQLPPRVHLTMIAIDEPSAARLAAEYGDEAPPVAPDPEWFSNPASYDDDMQQWEDRLKALTPAPHYIVLNLTVIIENSRWNP